MPAWFTVALTVELPPGSRKTITLNHTPILVFNLEGDFYAIQNRCTHADFPLDEGLLEDNTITCPYHGAKFCIISGEVKAPPAFEDVETYQVRVEGEFVQVLL